MPLWVIVVIERVADRAPSACAFVYSWRRLCRAHVSQVV